MVPFQFPGFYSYSKLYTDIKKLELGSTNKKEHVPFVFVALCYFTHYNSIYLPANATIKFFFTAKQNSIVYYTFLADSLY